jgi:hypothetical protein
MRALQPLIAVSLSCLLLAGLVRAADDDGALQTAQGVVEKVDKDTLTIKPRAKDGRFEKNLVLKLTGTSKVSLLSTQVRDNNAVLVQKDTDPKDLQANQPIAVVYTTGKAGTVLLSAVVQPTPGK